MRATRVSPLQSALAVALACCLVPAAAFGQTKSEDGGGAGSASSTVKSSDTASPSARVSQPSLPPARMEHTPVSMELSFEPAFFLGGNAPPDPGYFALVRLTGPIVGWEIGALTNVGLAGDTVEPLGNHPSLPASRTQTRAFVVGANFIHYTAELVRRGGAHLHLLLPEPDIKLLFSFANVPSSSPSRTSGGVVLSPSVSLLGLRFTRSLGGDASWIAELRAPTAAAYFPVMYGGDTVNPYVSLGFSIATGLAF